MKRRLLSVVLALVLIVSMAVPVLALGGSGTIESQPYTYGASKSTTNASGWVTYQGPSELFVSIDVYSWCNAHTDYISKYTYTYGRGNATVSVNNTVSVDNVTHTCSISYGYYTGKVGTQYLEAMARF